MLARPSRSRDISYVAGAGGDGQQGVIAPLAGIAVVACALLWPVRRSRQMVESRSMVRGRVAGSAPACQARASNSRLTGRVDDVAPPEAAQEGTQGGWRL